MDEIKIFIRSTIPVISGDFLTRWKAITVGKGRGSEGKKGQFLAISFFWIEVLGLLAKPFKLRRDCM